MERELTYTDLYADLIKAQTISLPENYFTLSQFCKDTGLTGWIARKALTTRVESGELDTMCTGIDGHYQRIWWFSENASLL